MKFRIVTQIEEADLKKIMDIDRIVYSAEYMRKERAESEDETDGDVHDYVGDIENMRARFRACRKSFVCLMDEEHDRLAGYINFIPCTTDAQRPEGGLYESILDRSDEIRDDDILPEEMAPYSKEENHLFILSIAMHPDYHQNREAGKMLSDGWIAYLNELQEQGYPITDISAAAVSKGGRRWLRNHMFTQYRKMADGNIVFLCREKCLERLLDNELYFKTYHDDIYLMLPLADHSRNHRMDELFPKDDALLCRRNEETENLEEAELYIQSVKDSLQYECTNDVVKELKIADLGTFTFLYTTDEYPQGEEEKDKKIVVGEEKIAAVLAAHRATHMYVLTLIMPDCRYSTTRVEDQLSYDYLRIRDPENPEEEVNLYDYLLRRYGLHKCGSGKCLLCMSNEPEEELEFRHILLGEAYNSIKVDYHPKSKKLDEICEENQSQYDYYDVYLSEMVIAFILKDKEAQTREEKIQWFLENRDDRIETMATYSFIVEVVMFQNIALAKATTKISNALANGGDISHEQVAELYRDFGKTLHFWEIHNFKYAGAQAEAEHVAAAFGNDKLKESYFEHQEFLEHMVELKTSQIQDRNGFIISIVGTVLAVIQIQDFLASLLFSAVGFINRFYGGDEGAAGAVEVQTVNISSLSLGIFIIILLIITVYFILRAKRRNMREINMRNLKRQRSGFAGKGDKHER